MNTQRARKRLKDSEYLAMCLERHFDMALQQIARQPEDQRAHSRAALLEQYKLAIHEALRKYKVQKNTSTQVLLRRLLAVQEEQVEVPMAGTNDIQCGLLAACLPL